MDTIVRKVNDFYNTYYAVLLFSAIGTVFAVLELWLFFTNQMNINNLYFSECDTTIKLVTTLSAVALSLVSLYFGFFIGIAITRGSKCATQLSLVGMALAIVLDVLAGLWLVCLEFAIIIPLVIVRKFFWDRELYKEEKYQFKHMWPYLLAVGISAIVLFYGVILTLGPIIYSWSVLPWMPAANADTPYVWYMDATVAWLGVLGAFCLFFRWRQAYFWYTIAKVPLIIAFAANGLLVQISQQVIWFLIDMGTVLALTHQQSEHKKEKENQ